MPKIPKKKKMNEKFFVVTSIFESIFEELSRNYLFLPILNFVVTARNRDWLSRSDRPLMSTKGKEGTSAIVS